MDNFGRKFFKMKQTFSLLFLFLAFQIVIQAQEDLKYQVPPASIQTLVDAPLAPAVRIDSEGNNVVLFYRNQYKTIDELSEDELRLGGLRINPKTNIGSRITFYNDIKVKKTKEREPRDVQGLPKDGRFSTFVMAPNEKMMAFLNTTTDRSELWLLDIEKAQAKKLSNTGINANLGSAITWFKNNDALLVKAIPNNRKNLINVAEAVPTGPTVTVSDGQKAQNRTYQDLLKNANDEFNFEQLALSELKKIDLSGNVSGFLNSDLYDDLSFSPDGTYLIISTIKKPFSYLVPYGRFPFESVLYTADGKKITIINDVPLDEVRPKGFMATREGKRAMRWRADKPATLYWAEALDKGDPDMEVDFRDAVYQLKAPFTGNPEIIFKTKNRYSGIIWGTDNLAIGMDYWWNTRNSKTYIFNPSHANENPKIIFDLNYEDKYNDPGSFVTTKNQYDQRVLELSGNDAYLIGDGYSEKGQFPFIDKINLNSLKTNRLYQSAYTDKAEAISSAIDIKKGLVLVRIESQKEYPNYFIRNINKKNNLSAITHFDNPFKSIQNVHKEVIKYKRNDGLDLEGTLYLPANYDFKKKEKLPMILWAYPREFKSKSSAGQSTTNPNKFIYPYYGSPIYWVTRGYVVLDNADFPIVGEGDAEPNDTFVSQLVANAKAAIDAVDKLGYADRSRVGVGGHSYGAFMVANLLSHSDLFAAGIARSGAYNRTLTPFGFQSEERSYWDAPDVYNTMSPFMQADKLKAPILLIHGADDNNSGTYPMQSERYFNALKGLGATARLVMLPKESHGYSAKESILHMLWEQDEWLEKYVKQSKQD